MIKKKIFSAAFYIFLFSSFASVAFAKTECLSVKDVYANSAFEGKEFCSPEAAFLAHRSTGTSASLTPFVQKSHKQFPVLLSIHQILAGDAIMVDAENTLLNLEVAYLLLNADSNHLTDEKLIIYNIWLLNKRLELFKNLSNLTLDNLELGIDSVSKSLISSSGLISSLKEVNCFVKLDHPSISPDFLMESKLFKTCVN